MGFLTGAYLKMMNARMRLQLQNQLTTISMQMQRVTKEMGQMERMLNRQQQMGNAAMKSQMQASIFSYQNQMQAKFQGQQSGDATDAKMYAEQQMAMQALSNFQMMQQTQVAQQQSIFENNFEMLREAQLEPLKNLESNLAIEKANIESRIKLIEGQEKAAEDMEKSSQKDFVPQYTGGGG